MIDLLEIKIDNAQYIIEGVNIKQNQNTKVAEFLDLPPLPTEPILKTESTERGTYRMETKEAF
jgi:hypothetical protein